MSERKLKTAQTNACAEALVVHAVGEPGSGGASHLYRITGFNTESNPSCPFQDLHGEPAQHSTVLFQNGPIKEAGVNGVTHEVLLEILIDRMRCFQYCCRENGLALTKLEEALMWLNARTTRRFEQGVEGTHQGR